VEPGGPTVPPLQLFDPGLLAERDYWLALLGGAGAPAVEAAAVPAADAPAGGPAGGPAAASVSLLLPPALVDGLRGLTGGDPLLLYTALAAGLAICLWRHSGSRRLTIASPALAATPARAPNAVALLLEVDPGASFRQLLLRTRGVLVAAYARQRYPWERLARELAGGAAAPFRLAAGLAGLHGPLPALRPEIEIWFRAGAAGLEASAADRGGGRSRAALLRFLGHLRVVLGAAVEAAATPAGELPWLSAAERQQVLLEWAAPGAGGGAPASLPERVLAHAAARPAAVAVEAAGRCMTFGELALEAAVLAERLRARGIGPDRVVAVLLPRSCELVAALLAVLAAGGAYLPLDPGLPPERLGQLAAASGAALLLSRRSLAAGLAADAPALWLDEAQPPGGAEERRGMAAAAGAPPGGCRPHPEQLAYVLFTSGSTGAPKAVMVTHGGLANYLDWSVEAYGAAAGSGAPVHTSIGFDLTVTSLWSPLAAGRRAILLAGDSPAPALTAAGGDGALSLVKLTPAHLDLLRHELADAALAARARVWVVGGEALRAESVAAFRAHAPAVRWINEYGPTEATVGCCTYEIGAADPGAGAVPIGRPIPGAAALVLDADLAPVAAGVTGGLYLGGACLARGYLGQPAATAERFVPDPRGAEPGARLYRTGDLACLRADGILLFLGREDWQLKIRGHRIEPAEVEAALQALPGVAAAAVAAQGEGARRQLIAFLVAVAGARPAPWPELRGRLACRLPPWMLPDLAVWRPALPMAASGKLDRRALATLAAAAAAGLPAPPAPSAGNAVAPAELPVATPANPFEELIAAAWCEVLGRPQVGLDDDFFALGGQSLLAAQVLARLRRTLGLELSLAAFFAAPTPRQLASAAARAVRQEAPPRAAADRGSRLPLSFAQQRLWFLEQLPAWRGAFNVPLALRIDGPLAPALLARCLAEVVRRHEALRTVFPAPAGAPEQRVLPAAAPPLPLVDLGGLGGLGGVGGLGGAAEAETMRLAGVFVRRPFDLERGPLLRAMLLRRAPGHHLLALACHHAVVDGWSLGVLVAESSALYRAFAAGLASPLPDLAWQYPDYAVWQISWLAAGGLDGQLEYWRHRLGALRRAAALPSDFPRPGAGARGSLLAVALPPELAADLRLLARREGSTLFMVLLAAFKAVLRAASGADLVIVGTDAANRTPVETEPMIGFFVNQVALATDLGGDPTLGEALARVRETAIGALAHQDLPFDRVVDGLRLPRAAGAAALFQVKLILQNLPGGAPTAPGLTFTRVMVDNGTAQLDLTVGVGETPAGIEGWANYRVDLFRPDTVGALLGAWRQVLETMTVRLDTRLSELGLALGPPSRRRSPMDQPAPGPAAAPSPFRNIKPRAVSLDQGEQLVETGPLQDGSPLPLVYRPRLADLDLAEWAASHRAHVEERLRRHGALLFRGFRLEEAADFERFAAAVCDELFNENGEHPREAVSGNVYTPVFYPPDQKLLWHNENSFNRRWPAKILFCCMEPPEQGGETPLVDSRAVFARLPAGLRGRFVERGVLYTRSYGSGLGRGWHEVFQTDSRSAVEERCRADGMQAEWRPDGGLRTSCRRPAAVRHPHTGEEVWFNQAQHWHLSCLDAQTRDSIVSLFAAEDYPRHCYYGDGSPIDDGEMAAILDAYRDLEVSFPWQRGDVLLLDNLLCAHARNAFRGRRKILVALGDMSSFDQVAEPRAGGAAGDGEP
jgi:amino acid adenylation domain-containing protein